MDWPICNSSRCAKGISCKSIWHTYFSLNPESVLFFWTQYVLKKNTVIAFRRIILALSSINLQDNCPRMTNPFLFYETRCVYNLLECKLAQLVFDFSVCSIDSWSATPYYVNHQKRGLIWDNCQFTGNACYEWVYSPSFKHVF